MTPLYVRPSFVLLLAVAVISTTTITAAILMHFLPSVQFEAQWHDVPYIASLLLAVLALFDYVVSRRPPPIRLTRDVPGSISVNKWAQMNLMLEHGFAYETQIELCDLYSNGVELSDPRLTLQLLPDKATSVQTKLRAHQRGDLLLAGAQLRLSSRLKLWQFVFALEQPVTVKVYPDFEAIVGYTLLATDNHASQLGIRVKPKRGEGLDFLQLREYRAGDTMRQIDWKATSRRQQLVSKEYRDERDQQVVLLIDSGRQMRAKDDTLSHFDHALNAALLLSYIALRQGDSVSVMSFGNMMRWMPAHKGAGSISSILNGVYDLHSGIAVSDYVEAARNVMLRQRKRSLVVLITNTRGEQIEELISAVTLLRKSHLVLLANIQEQVVSKVQQRPVQQFEDALRYSAVWHYQQQRRTINETLRSQNIYTLDCPPQQLAIQVANSYLGIKRAGSL